jgi:hypothetical protein
MKERSAQAASTQLVRIFYIVFVIAGGFVILNLAAGALMDRRVRQGRKVVFNARDPLGNAYMLMCHEGVETPYYDFLLKDAKQIYPEITVAPGQQVDAGAPVACVRYPMDAHSMELRLAAAPPRRPGARRIVVIGDSFTYGEGVPKQRAFPETMQHYAHWFGTPGAWQILNFGFIGQDFPGMYTDSFRTALRADPDILLYAWLPNDTPRGSLQMPEILESAAYFNSRGYIQSLGGLPLSRLLHIIAIKRRINAATIQWYQDLNGPRNKQGIEELREYMETMKRECGDAGVEFRVALFPMLLGGRGGYALAEQHAYIAELLKREGIPVLDLAPAVLDRPAARLFVHSANFHPNVMAHRNAARALANDLGLTTRPMPSVKQHAAQRRIPGQGLFSRGRARGLEDLLALESLEYPQDTIYVSDSASVRNSFVNRIKRRAVSPSGSGAASEACEKSFRCVAVTLQKSGVADLKFVPGPCASLIHMQDGQALRFCPIPAISSQ